MLGELFTLALVHAFFLQIESAENWPLNKFAALKIKGAGTSSIGDCDWCGSRISSR